MTMNPMPLPFIFRATNLLVLASREPDPRDPRDPHELPVQLAEYIKECAVTISEYVLPNLDKADPNYRILSNLHTLLNLAAADLIS